ncbi:nuclear body protein, partial [Clarias magur]
MDPLDFMTEEDMVHFFRRKKTQISCIKEPQTFLDQLRDHDLVDEDLYWKVIKKKNKNMRKGVYEILDWVENNRRQYMKTFWSCVFEDHILQEYPNLRSLQKTLLNEKIILNKEGGREEKKQAQNKGATKRERNAKETDHESPGPSSVSNQKKPDVKPLICPTVPQKPAESLKRKYKRPVKRRGCAVPQQLVETLKRKRKLPVRCGKKKGVLHKAKFKKGEPCILYADELIRLSKFEKIGGKEKNKKWRISIFYKQFNLQALIK